VTVRTRILPGLFLIRRAILGGVFPCGPYGMERFENGTGEFLFYANRNGMFRERGRDIK